MWDSGKTASSDQSYVPYGGPALAPGEAYRWSVKTWDRGGDGVAGGDATFETGLGNTGWSGANWIRRVTTGNDSSDDWTLARKTFPALGASPVTRARVYASAMGNYRIHVNGKPSGSATTSTTRPRRQYYAFDATDAVKAGRAAGARRALPLLDLHLPGPRERPDRNTTLSAAQAVDATNLRVASVGRASTSATRSRSAPAPPPRPRRSRRSAPPAPPARASRSARR